MTSNIAERLRAIVPENMSQDEFADSIAVKPASMKAWLRGVNDPNLKAVRAIAATYKVDLNWLIEGQNSIVINNGSDMTLIRHFDIEASAGNGTNAEGETQLAPIAFSRAWLRATANVPPEQLSVITARGDSMTPTFRSGALLLVNHGLSDFEGDGIYAINLDGDLYVKRLQKRLGGGVVVTSDNPRYTPMDVPNLDAVNMTVIGEVVWHGDWI